MAVYRNISLSFWTDSKIEDTFSPEDKYMYLYLLTNPHTNICGCYEVSMKQISRQTGYNEDMVERIIQRLERAHKVIRYCKETQELLIINWGKYNWTTSDKLVKPITTAINAIKCRQFKEYVGLLFDHIDEIHTLSIPYPYGIDTTGIDTTVSVSVTVPDTGKRIVKGKGTELAAMFNTFWVAYPRKQQKEDARKAFLKVKPDGELMDVILAKLEAYKHTDQWEKDGGQFIPYPATWLNKKCWEDEIPDRAYGSEEKVKWA